MIVNGFNYFPNSQIKQSKKCSNVTFGTAWVNIASMADNHGCLTTMPQIFEAVKVNLDKIFPRTNPENTLNIFAHIGDMLINPRKKGFITNPKVEAGDIQLSFFKTFFDSVNQLLKKREPKAESNELIVTYTPGNHCFEGGVKWLFTKLKKMRFQTVLTNAKVSTNGSSYAQKIYVVADDKNPRIKHKVLVLGLTNPNLEFFVPKNMLNSISLWDASSKSDTQLLESDFGQTIENLRKIISAFKKKNPNGAVVLQHHTAEQLSEIIARKIPHINLILDAHAHKCYQKNIDGVQIISHGQNNGFFRGTRLLFNDAGNASVIGIDTFVSKTNEVDSSNPLIQFLKTYLGKDTSELLQISCSDTDLNLAGIRYKHNLLANLMTDIIYGELKKLHTDLDAAGIISSTFRGGLKNGSNNLEIMKVLDGSTEAFSEMCLAKLNGADLCKILSENVQANIENPGRNSLIQWSGIQIDKKLFSKLPEQYNNPDLSKAFKIRQTSIDGTASYAEIEPDKVYRIALPLKYVQKYCPHKLKKSFNTDGMTLNNLFVDYLRQNNYSININPNTYEERVIV